MLVADVARQSIVAVVYPDVWDVRLDRKQLCADLRMWAVAS